MLSEVGKGFAFRDCETFCLLLCFSTWHSRAPLLGQRFASLSVRECARSLREAIIGMFFQDGLTGSAWGDWALYTGSPLRALEKDL